MPRAEKSPFYSDVKLDNFKMNRSCVVRAFSSALRVTPSDTDYRLRRRRANKFHHYAKNSGHIHETTINHILYAQDAIARKTPVGNALQGRQIETTTVTRDKLIDLLRTGEDVLVQTPGHVAHVVLWLGLLIAKSDNLFFFMKRDQRYSALIIRKI